MEVKNKIQDLSQNQDQVQGHKEALADARAFFVV